MNLKYFEIHLVEHCNLKCQSCDNFSAIAEEEFLDKEEFDKEMGRMAELFDIKFFRMLGGEPLLHPEINYFIETARKHFPKSLILITTNAILLDKMPEDFWTCCDKNDIVIEYTYYPINIDREKHLELAKKYNVSLIPFENRLINEKTSYRNPINDKKDQDINYNFSHCYHVHKCISLKDGKIYPCTCIPNICHFNKFFGKNLEVTDKDYIDIYTHNTAEIEAFLDKPVPFCGYCNVYNRTGGKQWATTKKDITEWMDV